MQLIISDNLVLCVNEYDDITGGDIIVNGKVYKGIKAVAYKGEIPADLAPERYLWDGKKLVKNDKAEKTIKERIEALEDEIKKK